MSAQEFDDLFPAEVLARLFPAERADQFFEALFGDATEGSYDIALQFDGFDPKRRLLNFALHLQERPQKCLACNLTHGLPQVFGRHPVININGLVREIDQLLANRGRCQSWSLGSTIQASRQLHIIPLVIKLN